jgi:hypothetical protein
MGALIITQVAASVGALVGFWAMLEHFDKRNEARFRALAKRIDEFNDALKKEIESLDCDEALRAEFRGEIRTLRAEMREMRVELRSYIREMGERRVIRG